MGVARRLTNNNKEETMAINSLRAGLTSSARLQFGSTTLSARTNKNLIVAANALPQTQHLAPAASLLARASVPSLNTLQRPPVQAASLPQMPITILPKPARTKETEKLKKVTSKENEILSRKEDEIKKISLLNKITQPRNLCLIGAVVAVKAGFAFLAVKLGPLAATQLLAQHTIAFLTPGMYVLGYALEVALKVTITVMMNGILPIVLPILSTIVVTGLAFALTVYIGYLLVNAAKDKLYAVCKAIEAELDKNPITKCVKNVLVAIYSKLLAPQGVKKLETTAPIASAIPRKTFSISSARSLLPKPQNFSHPAKKLWLH